MQHLVGEEIAAVARREPIDKLAVGLHRAERRRVILARRAEQLGPGAVVRGAQDDHQLGRLVRHQLVVRMRIGGGAAARIDMRRDQAGQRRRFLAVTARAGSFGRIEERRDLEPQLRRLFLVAEPAPAPPGGRDSREIPRARAARVRETPANRGSSDLSSAAISSSSFSSGMILAEALRKRGLDILQRHCGRRTASR